VNVVVDVRVDVNVIVFCAVSPDNVFVSVIVNDSDKVLVLEFEAETCPVSVSVKVRVSVAELVGPTVTVDVPLI
jgi:hypothetical protein